MALHEDLKTLHKRMQNPEEWEVTGICSKVPMFYSADLQSLFERWPMFSGVRSFPVAHPHLHPADVFMESMEGQMWDRKTSEYAENRWQLLEWLIEETKP